jgi:hypothetical protein
MYKLIDYSYEKIIPVDKCNITVKNENVKITISE